MDEVRNSPIFKWTQAAAHWGRRRYAALFMTALLAAGAMLGSFNVLGATAASQGGEPSAPVAVQKPGQTWVPVLLYHIVTPQMEIDAIGRDSLLVSEENFREQMAYLKDNGFTTLRAQDVIHFVNTGEPLPEKSVLITFDDAYLDIYTYAYPILKEYGQRATVFAHTYHLSPVKLDHYNTADFPKLSWDLLITTRDVFEFGSHSHNMHYMKNNRPAVSLLSASQIYKDIETSSEFLGFPGIFAYPYGAYNDTVIRILKELRFSGAFTTERKYATHKDSAYKIPRFTIGQDTAMSEFKSIVNGGKAAY